MERLERELDTLLKTYRDTVAPPDPSARFMPALWDKIESRRSYAYRLKRVTQVFVGAAALMCLLFGGIMVLPEVAASPQPTYLDALAEAHPVDVLAEFAEPTR